jgi:hypothetical protein
VGYRRTKRILIRERRLRLNRFERGAILSIERAGVMEIAGDRVVGCKDTEVRQEYVLCLSRDMKEHIRKIAAFGYPYCEPLS